MNPNTREINAAAQYGDPASVFHHYRRLIELRHSEPAVALGDFTMLLPDDESVYAFVRRHEQTELLVLVNVGADVRSVTIPEGAQWSGAELLLGNVLPDPVPSADRAGPADLRPWEARVYRRHMT